MRRALYTHLVANSGGLPVYNREDAVKTPGTGAGISPGYVVLWEEGTGLNDSRQGSYNFRVAIHYPPGYSDAADDYLDGFGYLFKDPISNAGKYYKFEAGDISESVSNDDHTLSRDRLLYIPAWG
jgi:hypothetical protein